MISLIGTTFILTLFSCTYASLNFKFLKNYEFAIPSLPVGEHQLVEGDQVLHWTIGQQEVGILTSWSVDRQHARKIQAMLFALDYSISQIFTSDFERPESYLVIKYSRSDCHYETGKVEFRFNGDVVLLLDKVQMLRKETRIFETKVMIRKGVNKFKMVGTEFAGETFCGVAVLSTNIYQPLADFKRQRRNALKQ